MNKIEDNLNSSQDSPNTESIIITGKKQVQTSYNDVSSISTAVNIMNDDPANWPTAMNNNVRDYLVVKGSPNIPGNSFPRNRKGLCFSKFHCKRKLLNAESVEKPWIIIIFFFYLFSFLLTINLKLIIVHVEIKIVNKEAATKRSTLLHTQRQLLPYSQSLFLHAL